MEQQQQQPSDSSLYRRGRAEDHTASDDDDDDDIKVEEDSTSEGPQEEDDFLKPDDVLEEPDNPTRSRQTNIDERTASSANENVEDDGIGGDGTFPDDAEVVAAAVEVGTTHNVAVEQMIEPSNVVDDTTKAQHPMDNESYKCKDEDDDEEKLILHSSDLVEQEPSEDIIPVASARIIPMEVDEMPIIRVTAMAPPEHDEEIAAQQQQRRQQPYALSPPVLPDSDSHGPSPPGLIASGAAAPTQRVMLDEDGASARRMVDDAILQRSSSPSEDRSKSKRKRLLILLLASLIIVAAVVTALVVLMGRPRGVVDNDDELQTPNDNSTTSLDDGSPTKAPSLTAPPPTTFPYTWAVEEFGYPELEGGTTFPWTEFDTLEECVDYCEAISSGIYVALAFVSESSGLAEIRPPDYPVDPTKPNCYCYQFVFCLLGHATSSNGTVLSSVQRPPNCAFDDDDEIVLDVGDDDNVTVEVISIENDGRREHSD